MPAYSADHKVSLEGLDKLCVVTEQVHSVYRKAGFDRKYITRKIRQALSKAGLSISTKQEYKTSACKIPILSVSIQTISSNERYLTNTTTVRLIDIANLKRMPKKEITVTSWSAQRISNIPRSKPEQVVTHTLSLIDKFIANYKAANRPKTS